MKESSARKKFRMKALKKGKIGLALTRLGQKFKITNYNKGK